MIHDRTQAAIVIATIGGYVGGAVGDGGVFLAALAFAFAFWYVPDARDVAREWTDYVRGEEGENAA